MRRTLIGACCVALLLAEGSVAWAGDVDVTQKGKAFLPGEVTLNVGEAIVFHNDDSFAHNMFSRSKGHEFNLKLQEPGQELRQKFDKPGTALVRCAIHPKMELVVTVEE